MKGVDKNARFSYSGSNDKEAVKGTGLRKNNLTEIDLIGGIGALEAKLCRKAGTEIRDLKDQIIAQKDRVVLVINYDKNDPGAVFMAEFKILPPASPKFKRPGEMKDDRDYGWESDDSDLKGVSDPGEDLLEESYEELDYDLIWPDEQEDIEEEGWTYTTPYELANAAEPVARRFIDLVYAVGESGEELGFPVDDIKHIAKVMNIPLDTIEVDGKPFEEFPYRRAVEYIDFGDVGILRNAIVWLDDSKRSGVQTIRFDVVNEIDGEYQEGEYFFDNIKYETLTKMLRKWHDEGRR